MSSLDWQMIKDRYTSKPVSYTKNGKPFRVCKITDNTLFVDLPNGPQSVSRTNLEKAVNLINKGAVIEDPLDYKRLVYDERPTYAWAILRDLGFIK